MSVSIEQLNSQSVPSDFVPAKQILATLQAQVDKTTAEFVGESNSTISINVLRREILKLHNSIESMAAEYEALLGLDFVSQEEAAQIKEVADVRQLVSVPFLQAYNLETHSNRVVRAVREANKGESILDEVKETHLEVTECRKVWHAMFWSLPDLGMTFEQWNEMPEVMRKKLRPAGRPGMPLECRMIQAREDLNDLMAKAYVASNGKLTTVEQAIEGVTKSNRGRPSVSNLAKLDGKLANLRKELEELASAPKAAAPERAQGTPGRLPATTEEKIEKVLNKIHNIEMELRVEESNLRGVEVPRRMLEKLRAEHRELVTLENQTSGAEQTQILMKTLKNELEQIDVINLIYEKDENAKETPTHQVNPKATRDRINLLRMSEHLSETDSKELVAIEESLRNSKVVRAR